MSDIDILQQKAVDAAIAHNWNEAIALNEKIIEIDKHNLPAYLRLGFAFLQLKKTKEAKKYYNKALKIQPKNTVALENLERIRVLENRGAEKMGQEKTVFNPNLFLEIPTKTKTVALVNLGQKNILAQLVVGQKVELKIKRRRVEIRTRAGDYVGSLPDDLSKRLIFFLKAKTVYSTFIKEATLNRVVVFIKEEKKGKQVASHVSFPQTVQKDPQKKMFDEEKFETKEVEIEEENSWEKLLNEAAFEEKEEMLDIQPEEVEEEEEE